MHLVSANSQSSITFTILIAIYSPVCRSYRDLACKTTEIN